MIYVKRPKPPTELASAAKTEWEKYQLHLQTIKKPPKGRKAGDKPKSFPFAVYKIDPVKRELERVFKGKCAYCECKYVGAPAPVEHIRPKGRVDRPDDDPVPGYDWLSADWSNLVPSCTYCNSPNKDFIPALGKVRTVGKANWFPLADEKRRARRKGDERREYPLLLNPCDEDPEPYFVFDKEGQIEPAPKLRGREKLKAEQTIDILGLGRRKYIEYRKNHALLVEGFMTRCKELYALWQSMPKNAAVKNLVINEWRELQKYQESDAPYTAMAKQIVNRGIPAKMRKVLRALAG
jgi:uncharacterized protein (TIGR02646 family)